jgi:DNA-binding MarR family transcriptional regulator
VSLKDSFSTPSPYLHALGNMMEREADATLTQNLQISFTQFMILMSLKKNQAFNQKELAACIGITEAAISRQIESLTSSKLLTVTDDPYDRRRKQLKLTSKGEEKLKKCIQTIDNMSKELFSVLTKDELDKFTSYLIRILKQLNPDLGL